MTYGELIPVAINYVFKWVEAVETPTNDSREVIKFVKRTYFQDLVFQELLLVMEAAFICSSFLQ